MRSGYFPVWNTQQIDKFIFVIISKNYSIFKEQRRWEMKRKFYKIVETGHCLIKHSKTLFSEMHTLTFYLYNEYTDDARTDFPFYYKCALEEINKSCTFHILTPYEIHKFYVKKKVVQLGSFFIVKDWSTNEDFFPSVLALVASSANSTINKWSKSERIFLFFDCIPLVAKLLTAEVKAQWGSLGSGYSFLSGMLPWKSSRVSSFVID